MESLKHVGRFVLNTVIGATLFALIVCVAVLLNLLGNYVAALRLHAYIALGVDALEFFLFALDVALFVAFEIREAYILFRSIWK